MPDLPGHRGHARRQKPARQAGTTCHSPARPEPGNAVGRTAPEPPPAPGHPGTRPSRAALSATQAAVACSVIRLSRSASSRRNRR
jgi:hypothetical protein